MFSLLSWLEIMYQRKYEAQVILRTILRPGDIENRVSPRNFLADVAKQDAVIIANCLLATLSDVQRIENSLSTVRQTSGNNRAYLSLHGNVYVDDNSLRKADSAQSLQLWLYETF